MKSVKTGKFKKAFEKLPIEIQGKAWLTYHLWKSNHYIPNYTSNVFIQANLFI